MAKMMQAWMADGEGNLQFGDTPVPIPAPDQAIVQVKSTTVARGEIRYLPYFPKGKVLGLDLAGIVVKPAADGSGPPEGSRVITMTSYYGGGWGQYAALSASVLGVIPDRLSWSQAAMLPNSGLTALYAVRRGGLLLGRKVLVTGATGAVGRLAAQLAKLSGAEVTGTVSRAERAASLKSLGLHDVVVMNDSKGPFDLVVETIGGGTLGHALEVVDPEGVVVTLGGGAGFDEPDEPAVVPVGWFHEHHGARLEAENVGIKVMRKIGVARDLGVLAQLAAEERLDLDIEKDVGWRDALQVVEAFKAGKLKGRVALLIE